MPTLIEMPEPELVDQTEVADTCTCEPETTCDPTAAAPSAEHALFSDSLLESSLSERRRRGLATTLSIAFQFIVIGGLLIVPLLVTEALPSQQLLTFLVAPPPPPPPPPPAAATVAKVVQTNVLNDGQLRTPTRIPQKVEMIREQEAPPPMAGGVVGGVPGGIPGGQLGGVIGGIISTANSASMVVPKLEPVKRIRISQGVTQGMLIKKVEPAYPKIALLARITGVVLVKAIINTKGEITEAEAVTGHPFLVPAALDAVKQWHYHPYLLNGVPVEVETNVTVTFQIAD